MAYNVKDIDALEANVKMLDGAMEKASEVSAAMKSASSSMASLQGTANLNDKVCPMLDKMAADLDQCVNVYGETRPTLGQYITAQRELDEYDIGADVDARLG